MTLYEKQLSNKNQIEQIVNFEEMNQLWLLDESGRISIYDSESLSFLETITINKKFTLILCTTECIYLYSEDHYVILLKRSLPIEIVASWKIADKL